MMDPSQVLYFDSAVACPCQLRFPPKGSPKAPCSGAQQVINLPISSVVGCFSSASCLHGSPRGLGHLPWTRDGVYQIKLRGFRNSSSSEPISVNSTNSPSIAQLRCLTSSLTIIIQMTLSLLPHPVFCATERLTSGHPLTLCFSDTSQPYRNPKASSLPPLARQGTPVGLPCDHKAQRFQI